MTIRDLYDLPWIGDGAVLDLANTVLVGAAQDRTDIDVLADPALTARWRARAADRRLSALPLADLVELRAPVRAALDAAAGKRAVPDGARSALNELAATAPVVLRVTADGRLEQQDHGGGPAEAVARETLVLVAGPDHARLRRCPAPSCGMFFVARRRDQAWCTVGCGNRARSTRRRPREATDGAE
ncbi:ABATE domain-containing protein [Kitasatospora purpeofusca]|uniref:ABATE domain-containing protein n=1 Tax=Kitasatospora purpeofusca TaxID=67352 RepID=UPI0036D3E06E